MGSFETTAITVPYRRRCEDRVKVLNFDDGVVIAVADGAGGSGAGDQAAETVIREITESASLAHVPPSDEHAVIGTQWRLAGLATGVCTLHTEVVGAPQQSAFD